MDPFLLICAAVVIVAIIGYVTYLQKNKEPEDKPFRCNICGSRFANYNAFSAHKATHAGEEGEDGARGVGQRREGAAMAGGMRRTRQRRTMATARRQDDSDSGEDSTEEAVKEAVANIEGKVGKKKLQKIQDKEEKRRQREIDALEREEQKKREEERKKQKEKEEAIKAQEEAAKEEEERKKKEEQERQEYEEYLKLKEQFSVEEEGQDQLFGADAESLLLEFINYIKEMKVVMLEDLAAHFKLKTKDVIDRLNTLLEEERLTGVLDDRGKFIYITNDEYEAVAKFIRQRGRVSITELAESSNQLINLNPDNSDTHRQLIEGKTVA